MNQVVIYAFWFCLMAFCVWYIIKPVKPKKDKKAKKKKPQVNNQPLAHIPPPNIDAQLEFHAKEFWRLQNMKHQKV